MGDEEDPWGADDSAETNEQPSAQASKVPQPETTIQAEVAANPQTETGEDKKNDEELAPPPPPPEDDGYRKPVQLYRHWVRPKFLQYKYMYNYRTNYYDDVIDYLDKKQTGVLREIPRPQTWAERVLRTNYSRFGHYQYMDSV